MPRRYYHFQLDSLDALIDATVPKPVTSAMLISQHIPAPSWAIVQRSTRHNSDAEGNVKEMGLVSVPGFIGLLKLTDAIVPQAIRSAIRMSQQRRLARSCSPVPPCRFAPRHNSASEADVKEMVSVVGFNSLDELIDATVPEAIRRHDRMDLGKYTDGLTESEFLAKFK